MTGALPRIALTFDAAAPLAVPDETLRPLTALLPDGGVLALGEPTHGTREAFELKHRLIRLLAEEGRLRVLAFECARGPAEHIDHAVRLLDGDVKDALRAQDYWCWESREVLALLSWLRAFNARRPPEVRVRFVGVDVQRPERVAERVEGHVTCPDMRARLRALCEGTPASGDDAARFTEQLQDLASSAADADVRRDARHLYRHVRVYLDPTSTEGIGLRDRFMAEELLETLPSEGVTVVWAHNEHVAVNEDFFGSPAMGFVLREALGERYVALGMLFGYGGFRARAWRAPERPLRDFEVGRANGAYVERQFDALEGCVLDLRGRRTKSLRRRFLGFLFDHEVARERPEAFEVVRPLSDFDLLAWLPRTTPSRALGDQG